MKKLLLLAAGMMLASSAVMAEETTVTPTVYPNYVLTGLSPNGEWTVSADPFTYAMTIINVKTGEVWEYADESLAEIYDSGLRHYVSDNGVVVGTYNENVGVYWENGKWNFLACKDTDFSVYPVTVTPDGSVIGGFVSRMAITLEDTGDVMSVPVVWYRNADGTYGDYVELPYPKTDWTGRVPQYVLIDDISADGKVCAGNVIDYSGMAPAPIVFTQKDNGEWEYSFVHPELLNPDNVEFPAYPGEAPQAPDPKEWMTPANADRYDEALAEYYNRPYPQMENYMTEDELAAYAEAYNKYFEDPYTNPYPFMSDYMTEEEIAAYNTAVSDYYAAPMPDPTEYMSENQVIMYNMAIERFNIAAEKWNEEYAAFQEALDEATYNLDVVHFSMNSAIISPNGKYLGMTGETYVDDPMSWLGYTTVACPYLFDLETNEYFVMNKGMDNVLANQISDNGWVLGVTPMDARALRQSCVATGPEAEFQQLITLVGEQDEALYNWMKENMTHEVEEVDYVYNEETDDFDPVVTVKEIVAEGTTIASEDLSIFAGWIVNNWDYMDENYAYSYLYGLNGGLSGIKAVASNARDFNIYAQRGGIINIAGDVANVTVYDVNGRKVFNIDAPASQVSTGLSNGTYVVTAKAANGQMVTKKVVF